MLLAPGSSPTVWRLRAALALVAGGLLLSPLEAAALSCLDPGVTAPFRRSADVPTNTRIWCTAESQWPPEPIRLRDARGSLVGGTQTELSAPFMKVLVFRPDVELEPESTFTYECPQRDFEFTFTTAAGPALTAPPVPDLSRGFAEAVYRDDTGARYFASFSEAVDPDRIVVFDVGGDAALEVEGPSGLVSDALEAVGVGTVFVGSGLCLTNWPQATLGASTTVALGAFDVTGAFSGWSDPVTVTIPSTLDDQSLAGSAEGSAAAVSGSASGSDEERVAGCALRPPAGSARGALATLVATVLVAARRRAARASVRLEGAPRR